LASRRFALPTGLATGLGITAYRCSSSSFLAASWAGSWISSCTSGPPGGPRSI
jgi:hypothetical protein